jgi:hypothetical protein
MFLKKTSSLFLIGSLVCSHVFSDMPSRDPSTHTPKKNSIVPPETQKPMSPKFDVAKAESRGFKVVKEKNGESRLISPQGSKILLGKNEEVKEVETNVNGNNIKLSLNGAGFYDAQLKGPDGQLKKFVLGDNNGDLTVKGDGTNYTARVNGDSVVLFNHADNTTQTVPLSSLHMDPTMQSDVEPATVMVALILVAALVLIIHGGM